MPLVTTLIDDKSPLIFYDASWRPGTSSEDSEEDQFYLCTATTNNVLDAVANFSFNGTAFWIYGPKRSNHGTYAVQVDGASFANNSGYSAIDLFQQSLFNLSGLSQGLHNVSITNTDSGSLYVAIDLVVWQSEVGNDGDQLLPETVQDTDSRFEYQDLAWTTSPSNVNFFSNGTGHTTESYSASATLTFTGEAITLFGATGPSNGPYSVQLDSGQAVKYNATTFIPLYGVTLFHADNLGPGQHQLTVTNLPATSGQSLSIDYALLLTTSTSSSTTSSGDSSPSSSSNQMSTGAITGIVVSVVTAVLALAAAAFFYRRWKAAQAAQSDLYRVHPFERHPDVTTTAISSSLKTRRNAAALRSNTTPQTPAGSSNLGNRGAQHTSHSHLLSGQGPRLATVGEGTEATSALLSAPVDEALIRRPPPEAPETGSLPSAEPSNITGLRQSVQTVTSELPPPNYSQAMGGDTSHGGTARF